MLLETFPRINERICPSEHMTDRGKDYIVREALSRNTRDEIKRNESPYKKPPPSEGRRLLSHTTIRVNQVLSHRPSTCCRCGGIPGLSTVGTESMGPLRASVAAGAHAGRMLRVN